MWLYSPKVTFLATYSPIPEALTSFISKIFYCGLKYQMCFLKKPLNDTLQSHSNLFFFVGSVILSQCEMAKWQLEHEISCTFSMCVKLRRKTRDSRNNSGMEQWCCPDLRKNPKLENLNDMSTISIFHFCWSEYNKSMKLNPI